VRIYVLQLKKIVTLVISNKVIFFCSYEVVGLRSSKQNSENCVAFPKGLFMFSQLTRVNCDWKGTRLNVNFCEFKITEFY
jgi:hypothetical protein